jgi:predicted phosphohydrolase
MKIQLLSDLHLEKLEFGIYNIINNENSDVLIIVGDIDDLEDINRYNNFIKQVSKLYKLVFIVKGNHECYNKTIDETDAIISNVCNQYNNIIYLNKTYYDINENIRIVGCCFWSKILDEQKEDIVKNIGNFKNIKSWSVEKNNKIHDEELLFIKEQMECSKINNKKLIIATHYSPSINHTINPRFIDCPMSSAYYSNLDELLDEPVIAYVYGHTHQSLNKKINNVLLLSNQRGYFDDDNNNFVDEFCFDI